MDRNRLKYAHKPHTHLYYKCPNPNYSNLQLNIKHYYKLHKLKLFQKLSASLTRSTWTLALALDWGSSLPTGSFLTGKEHKQHRINELTSSASHIDKTENNDHQVKRVMMSSEQGLMI